MTDRRSLLLVLAALPLAAWLRVHGLDVQVVQDDEWHALHKLMASGYAEIARSFGLADHSIPLTLLYKAMAGAVGLDEVNLRALQVACGIALVALAAWLCLAARGDPLAAGLHAVLLAGAPFLVLYSRLARPYAITTLLVVATLALLWRWRGERGPGLAAAICLLTALAAWLHPICAIFAAVAMLWLLADALLARDRPRALATVGLGAAAAVAIALPLAPPLANDFSSLAGKAGGDFAGAYTLWRAASLHLGGLPDGVTAVALAVAAFGGWRLAVHRPALGSYIAAVAIVPVVVFAVLGAHWAHQGHTFARYVFPVQVVLLGWFAIGAVELLRGASARPAVAPLGALAIAASYLALNPAIRQVTGLGPWYGHVYHQFDYVLRHNAARDQYRGYEPPAFYRRLAALPAGSAPIIEAPFSFAAPANAFAHFATYHRQPSRVGLLRDLCLGGPLHGEVPKDGRFRFRQFVFLDDAAAVRASGARYLLLFREQLHAKPFAAGDRCIAALEALYGPPVHVEPRLAVFEPARAAGARKLQ